MEPGVPQAAQASTEGVDVTLSPKNETGKRKGRSTCCKILCCGCTTCCCILVALGIAVAVVAGRYTEPETNFQRALITNMSVASDRVVATFLVEVQLNNPNEWPITGAFEKLYVDVWSIDKDTVDTPEPIYLGQGSLPEPLSVETQSVQIFNLTIKASIANPDAAALAPRFTRDCSTGAGETKLRLNIVDSIATIFGMTVSVPDSETEYLVTCDTYTAVSTQPSSPNTQGSVGTNTSTGTGSASSSR